MTQIPYSIFITSDELNQVMTDQLSLSDLALIALSDAKPHDQTTPVQLGNHTVRAQVRRGGLWISDSQRKKLSVGNFSRANDGGWWIE